MVLRKHMFYFDLKCANMFALDSCKDSLTMIYLVGDVFFWMCVHLRWSARGYWPTYANWLPSSRENYFPRPLELRLLALSFWDINVLYKNKLFWMIRETLFVKVGFYPNGKAPSRNFDNNVPFSTEWWRGFSFFFYYLGGGTFQFFLNFQIRKANSKNSGHDVCFWSLISFVSKGKSLIPVCININLCKHQKHPKERYYPQCTIG